MDRMRVYDIVYALAAQGGRKEASPTGAAGRFRKPCSPSKWNMAQKQL